MELNSYNYKVILPDINHKNLPINIVHKVGGYIFLLNLSTVTLVNLTKLKKIMNLSSITNNS